MARDMSIFDKEEDERIFRVVLVRAGD